MYLTSPRSGPAHPSLLVGRTGRLVRSASRRPSLAPGRGRTAWTTWTRPVRRPRRARQEVVRHDKATGRPGPPRDQDRIVAAGNGSAAPASGDPRVSSVPLPIDDKGGGG